MYVRLTFFFYHFFSGFFGKAKKFFALDQDLLESDVIHDTPRPRATSNRLSGNIPMFSEPQELGKSIEVFVL